MTDALDTQIDLWRAHMERHATITTTEVDELEDHLRGHICLLYTSDAADE